MQEELRRRQEPICIHEEFRRRQEDMYMQEELRRRQLDMYIQEELRRRDEELSRRLEGRFREMFGFNNELRRQNLFRRSLYSNIRSPMYQIAPMQNQMRAPPIYRSVEFENREVNPNDIINRLPITILKNINNLNNDSKNCSICLENFKIDDKVIYLPCIHFFHEMCIKNWIIRKQFCPVCKLEINS